MRNLEVRQKYKIIDKMDLVKLIVEKVQDFETSGKLEEVIEKNVQECVEDIIKDSFQWSGEAKKSIKEALKGRLEIDPSGLNLSRYGKIVSQIVEDHTNKLITQDLANSVRESIDSIIKPLEKKEWKLSEIITKYIESLDKSHDGYMEDEEGEIGLVISESSASFHHIYFGPVVCNRKWEYPNSIGLHNGKIFTAKLGDKVLSPFVIESFSHFEEFLFRLYCSNVVVEIDEDSCELNYYREDYY